MAMTAGSSAVLDAIWGGVVVVVGGLGGVNFRRCGEFRTCERSWTAEYGHSTPLNSSRMPSMARFQARKQDTAC